MTTADDGKNLALRFLERVLPVDGFKCATVFDDGKVWNKFFATVDELHKFIGQQDALGRTVYHACAAFGSPDSRKQSNSIGASSFWLDIDAGDGKPYATATDAAIAVHEFCEVTGLPKPLYVGSGGGIHIYWPLAQILDLVNGAAIPLGSEVFASKRVWKLMQFELVIWHLYFEPPEPTTERMGRDLSEWEI